MLDNYLIKETLNTAKTIAIVGVSSAKEEKKFVFIKRRPSIIVMKYLKEFGYKVIPINPFSKEKKICEEKVFSNLEDINVPVDVVNVFRPSEETPSIAKQSAKIGAKVLWLQYGIHNQEAEKIAKSANIIYVANRCIKQEYQRLFLKMNPVFPALKN